MQNAIEVGGIITVHSQLRARLLPPSVRAALAKADEPEQDPASNGLLRGRQRTQHRIRAARERDGQAASLLEVKTLAEAVEWAKRAPFGLGVHDGEEPEVEIRPLFDPADFDVPGEAEERAKRLGEKLGKA